MANNCQLWLTTIVLTAIVLYNSVSVEAGKKKDKGLIIVLSNGGCGGNIVVETAGKDGKKGSRGHKIVVKGGDSGGGCGCSNSCGSCGGGDHHHVQAVPVPVPVPPGHPIPPMGPEMHAAMMSQLVPSYSADEPHQSSGSSGDSGDQDSQASDSATSATSSDDTSKDSADSSSDSASSSASEKAKMVAPLFIPMNAVTPPWFHGSPVFMDPSSQNHLSSTIKNMPNRYSSSSSSPSASQSESNYQQNGEKGEFAQSSNVAPTFNDPMFNLHGSGNNFMAPPMGYQGFDENPLLGQSLPASDSNTKNPSEANKTQGSGRGRSGYLQPLIDSVQRLLRGPGPLREIEQGLVRQGQRMQASFSNLVPISISNVTSYLPSLPGLRSSSGNRDRKPTTNRRSRYLESLRVRLRPLTTMEGNRLTPFIENLWKNIRGRGSTVAAPMESASTTNQVKSQELNNNLPGAGGHHVLPIDPANGHHPHHFNIPGQQNNQVMQQYLEQILTSKWWEWPTGGLLGPNLNRY